MVPPLRALHTGAEKWKRVGEVEPVGHGVGAPKFRLAGSQTAPNLPEYIVQSAVGHALEGKCDCNE